MTPILRRLTLLTLAAALSGCGYAKGLLSDDEAGMATLPPPPPPLAQPHEPFGLNSTMKLSRAAAKGGDYGAAIRILEAASNDYPAAAEPRIALGEAYMEMGSIPEAAQIFRDLAGLEHSRLDSAIGLGRVALASDDAAAAERHFTDALRLDPGARRAINGRAVALDLLGRHDEAQELYAILIKRDAADREALNNRALSLALAGRLAEARREMEVLTTGPSFARRARANLALVAALSGDEREARKLLRGELGEAQAESNLAFYKALRTGR